MKIGKDRELLEIEVKSLIPLAVSTIKQDEVDEIVEHLNSKHGIKSSDIYSLFNNVNNVSKLSQEELALFGQQCVIKIGINQHEWMDEWFTEREQKEFERYQFVDMAKVDEIDFPMVITNVTQLGNGFYNATLTKQQLARLYKYGKLNYNPNVQRGLRKVRKYGIEKEEPIIIHNKIREISSLIIKDELNPSTITLNASQLSALDGVEMTYDGNKKTLTIHEGTILDIVDGMHRTLGNYSAYTKEKDIKGGFPIVISNKSDAEIKRYQVDLDKHTPLTRSRIDEMESKSYSNEVVNNLKAEGQLAGKISTAYDAKNALKGSDFTTYKIIKNQIDSIFEVKSTLEARKLAKTIDEYLVYLNGIYEQYKVGDYSLLFDADVFEGHLKLVKVMTEKEVPFEKLEDIIDLREFDTRYSKLSKIINGKLKINNKDRKDIVKIFDDMIEKGLNNNV